MTDVLTCVFCKQPIAVIVGKFRHEVATANFMMGLLSNKEEMCGICYSQAKSNPPTKDEVDKENIRRKEDADKMLKDHNDC